jgi:hypothetical protein
VTPDGNGETPSGGANDKPSDTEIDEMESYEKQEATAKKNSVLRALLSGFKFTLKLEGVRIRLFAKEFIKR